MIMSSDSSDDSDDDEYGNAALKLENLYKKSIANLPPPEIKPIAPNEFSQSTSEEKSNEVVDLSDEEEDVKIIEPANSFEDSDLQLDLDIAKVLGKTEAAVSEISKKKGRATRSRAKKHPILAPTSPILPPKRTKRTTRNSRKHDDESIEDTGQTSQPEPSTTTSKSRKSTRGKSKSRGSNLNSKQQQENIVEATQPEVSCSSSKRPSRGGTRGKSKSRNSNRGHNQRNRPRDFLARLMNPLVYNIGIHEGYEDASESTPLFSSSSAPTTSKDEVIIMEDEDLNISLNDENEELSVKVFWQSTEYVRFKIRKFQKITQIFDFFSNRENIPKDNLLFTLGDRILKADDTPESIQYNIVKFIDGGIVRKGIKNMEETKMSNEVFTPGGIKIKFQCQNVKKPFEISVGMNQKLNVAMVKCAEHFEFPIDKLKFFFDGDILNATSTPSQLDMEGGECIDVKYNL